MDLSDRIRSWRDWAGLTVADLAEKVGVTTEAVYSWESGSYQPRLENVSKIASAIGVTLPEFWGLPPKRKAASS